MEVNFENQTENDQAAPIEEKMKMNILQFENAEPQAEPKQYDPNYPGTQYNVILNGILFHAISPPDCFDNEDISETIE